MWDFSSFKKKGNRWDSFVKVNDAKTDKYAKPRDFKIVIGIVMLAAAICQFAIFQCFKSCGDNGGNCSLSLS